MTNSLNYIIIDNRKFDSIIGARILKSNGINKWEELNSIWDTIKPLSFQDILKNFDNIEDRRVALKYIGIENIINNISSKLVSSVMLPKSTTWLNEEGELVTHEYSDVYELYKCSHSELGLNNPRFVNYLYFLKFKDTSTDRVYILWVDINSIYNTKFPNSSEINNDSENFNNIDTIDAIDAIAWTIQTHVKKNAIKSIIRQGDCILIEPISTSKKKVYGNLRHLTKEEYLTLLTIES